MCGVCLDLTVAGSGFDAVAGVLEFGRFWVLGWIWNGGLDLWYLGVIGLIVCCVCLFAVR